MKKGLKITVIVFKIIFVLLIVWNMVMLVSGIIALDRLEHNGTEDALGHYLGIGFLQIYCVACLVMIFCAALMILCLHIFAKNRPAAAPACRVLNGISLLAAAGANLFCYAAFCTMFCMTNIGDAPSVINCALLMTCTVICITSLIVSAVINAKNKRMLKAASDKGDHTTDGTDQPLS